ncbi:MAG: cellulase family glycosylhydrolase [Bacteroidota bacterium]
MMDIGKTPFIRTEGTKFMIGDKSYYFLGTNLWYGMNLGSKGKGGDRARLTSELDLLAHHHIKNLRIMGASEGPDSAPWRMVPSLQPSPGTYNEDLWEGLDYLLSEMGKRDMKAVICLGNFWPWSGGMAQYIQWFEPGKIPYPPPAKGGNWLRFQRYASQFFVHPKALECYAQHVQNIVSRKNSISGLAYKDDPTIMAWQLANEPRGLGRYKGYQNWIESSVKLIRTLDPNHLISLGTEGSIAYPLQEKRTIKDQALDGVDYGTFHIWAQNWGWFQPHKAEKTYNRTCLKVSRYINRHTQRIGGLNKPLVLEEFGISRDKDNHDPQSSTTIRDSYYKFVFEECLKWAKKGMLSGINFWAWGGQGRPISPKAIWKAGDPFIGDPPHEYQGWYSVYDTDQTTLKIIREFALKLESLSS